MSSDSYFFHCKSSVDAFRVNIPQPDYKNPHCTDTLARSVFWFCIKNFSIIRFFASVVKYYTIFQNICTIGAVYTAYPPQLYNKIWRTESVPRRTAQRATRFLSAIQRQSYIK